MARAFLWEHPRGTHERLVVKIDRDRKSWSWTGWHGAVHYGRIGSSQHDELEIIGATPVDDELVKSITTNTTPDVSHLFIRWQYA